MQMFSVVVIDNDTTKLRHQKSQMYVVEQLALKERKDHRYNIISKTHWPDLLRYGVKMKRQQQLFMVLIFKKIIHIITLCLVERMMKQYVT